MTANELLARFSEQQVAAFFLVLARVSPLFILAPLFSSKMIPGRVRSIIAVGLAVGLMPVVKHGTIDLDPIAAALVNAKEEWAENLGEALVAEKDGAPALRRLQLECAAPSGRGPHFFVSWQMRWAV